MKALSVRQPHATHIAAGMKTIENRSWSTTYRGPLLIVSSAQPRIAPAGQALCIVRLSDCRRFTPADVESSLVEFFPDGYAWVLDHVHRIPHFPVKGRLGLYEVGLPPTLKLLAASTVFAPP